MKTANCEENKFNALLKTLLVAITTIYLLGSHMNIWSFQLLQKAQAGKVFDPFLYIKFHKYMVASNMHFGYQICLKFGIVITKSRWDGS